MVKICNSPYPTENEITYSPYFAQFPYPLSDFQKYAIEHIVLQNHVLVTAQTGSGKTLPAEFAIQYYCKTIKKTKKQKVIYTSPIKALSNQKYYEFSKKYPDISFGILTGDIKHNVLADVLIMTTEILLNYITKGASANTVLDLDMNDVACVIFDEVHYINDQQRGHVWEQSILQLPENVQMIMLSATIDSPELFAKWIENRSLPEEPEQPEQKQQPEQKEQQQKKEVCLCMASKRIVPLTHYSFLSVGESIYKGIKDDTLKQEIRRASNQLTVLRSAEGRMNEPTYHQLKHMLQLYNKHDPQNQRGQTHGKRKFIVNSLMQLLKDRDMLPAIVFVFSRKQVELIAQEITIPLLEDDSKIPYTIEKECRDLLRGKPEYTELPEFVQLVKLLEKGIAIHHSGMIPIFREMVEMFIMKRYIKVLIATESFAVGLDCPIRTAVFVSLQKFDGQSRMLYSHEYAQMSGRAGRRGIDTVGHVVHCNNLFPLPTLSEYKEMLGGVPPKLISKFHISPEFILSAYPNKKTDADANIEMVHDFVKRSMKNAEIQKTIHGQTRIVEELETIVSLLPLPSHVIQQYSTLETSLSFCNHKKRKDLEKQMTALKESISKTLFDADLLAYKESEKHRKQLQIETQTLRNMEDYVTDEIERVFDKLTEEGFLMRTVSSKQWHLTKKGDIASYFAEVSPFVFAHGFVNHWQQFSTFSPTQIVGLLAHFIDVKEKETNNNERNNNERNNNTNNNNTNERKNDDKEKQHASVSCLFTEEYQNLLTDDSQICVTIADIMMSWCDCNNEHACKAFLYEHSDTISVGDFVKAVLKIANTIREIIHMVTSVFPENIELLHKLSFVEPMILKYITTSYSLYL